MEKKNIAATLRRAAETVAGWGDGPVPEIEKDALLALLGRIYSHVKSGVDICIPVSGTEVTGCDAVPPVEEGPTPIGVVDIPVVSTSAGISDDCQPRVHAMETMSPDTDSYRVEVSEVAAPAGMPVVESSHIVNSEDEKEEFDRNILFDESEIPAKPKLDRRAILSLYGEEPASSAPAVETRSPACNYATVNGDIPPVTPQGTAYVPPAGEPQPAVMDSEPVPVPVLGDVLGDGNRTVADFYAGQTDTTDVASVVGSGRVASLRQALGINDKFLLVRNLFDGNAEVCDNVLTTLDGFSDLDNALIYIHENFNWNPDSEAVKLLVDLLTRKLS